MKRQPIYVEVPIYTDIDAIWDASQQPDRHEQWDLRFSSITYLPKKEGEPQAFVYSRTVGPFLQVEGWGESVGSFHKEDGTRSSSLHFGTEQWISPIREGRGYWKYEPQEDHVKFLTQYDYEVNFGKAGEIADRAIFRPLIGWATALSFDVLKRWLEQGEAPRSQYMRFFSTYLMTLLFAFIWLYQGLIPKIIGMHPEERAMIGSALPISENGITTAVLIIGIAEVLFGLVWLVYRNKRQLFILQLMVFPLLTIATIVADPATTIHPFNPVTFNFPLIVLSIIGVWMSKDIPSATSCKRKR
ncbi:DoxX-like family protein [Sporosarcina sp. FSL K6-1522]|uniref:DoxX-like family protein n=1 Tax=Sporosarcina sp. FSL K6-1522 TaxID=2921554 RepID=UPI00315A3D72